MSIDATKPLATDLVSAIDDYIREDRAQINKLWDALVAANCTETDHEMGIGDFYLAIGTDLEDVMLELINLTAAAAVDLMQITLGSGGMIKIIRAGDGNVTVKHNASYIVLAGATDLTLTAGDVLVLINSGGDPDTPTNGVWYEITRSGAAAGEVNTASNVGIGTGEIYKQKTGVDLEFKTLIAGTNISLTNGTSEVTIEAAGSVGESNTASNVGIGGGTIYKQKSGVDLEFKSIKAGSNITVTNNASDITIAASGGSGGNTYMAASLGVADTELVGGSDVGNDANVEIVVLSADTAEVLQTISNCPEGSVKHIVISGANVSIGNSGNLMLRQPAGTDVQFNNTDTLSLVNVGGSVGVDDGTWYEIGRSLAV